MPDMVNHPPHYTQGEVECIEAIKAALGPMAFSDYCVGSTLKYLWRWRQKGGLQDLHKAMAYLIFVINHEESKR